MRLNPAALVVLLAAAWMAAGSSAGEKDSMDLRIYSPAAIKWREGPASPGRGRRAARRTPPGARAA